MEKNVDDKYEIGYMVNLLIIDKDKILNINL